MSDTSLVMVDIWSVGNYGGEEEKTRRLARPLCFLRREPGENGYARPIEGIRPVVDLSTMEVIRIEEYGAWPLPPEPAEYAASRIRNAKGGFRPDIRPLAITQPRPELPGQKKLEPPERVRRPLIRAHCSSFE